MTAVTRASIIARIAAAGLSLASLGSSAWADNEAVESARRAFIDRMVANHGFERDALAAQLDAVEINQDVLDAISRPAERVVPWYEYRNIFLTESRVSTGVQFWTQHAATLEAISERYGVAPEIIVAIVGVETFFGQRMGRYRVLDALATLAFAYPPRARFFASELESFLLLAREEDVDVAAVTGSYAGAMGAGQFIPSSYRAYAVDANADGRRNLWGDWEDVLGSVANYFKEHGWRTGQPVVEQATRAEHWSGPEPENKLELAETIGSLSRMGYVFTTELPEDAPAAVFALEAEGGGSEYWVGYHNFRVITRYNRSPKYALAAHQLSQAIRARYSSAAASVAAGVAASVAGGPGE
jgi:membrane-bound lytic murein transglycosylase B